MSSHQLRKPCVGCGSDYGRIVTRNGQDCVYCEGCNRYQYNAPKTETGREVRSVQTTHTAIKPNQRVRILLRANGRCELCGRKGEEAGLHVGHLVSVKAGTAGGMSDDEINSDENLSAMCAECNLGLGQEPVPLRLAIRLVMERRRINPC